MRFIGDIHACFKRYEQITRDVDRSIQVGDFGLGFGDAPVLSENHRFIRGNHDDPELCRKHSRWIPDGSVVFEKIFCVGGASSVDKNLRTNGVDWWEDEEIPYSQWADILTDYERTKPSAVVSHDCPSVVAPYRDMSSLTVHGLDAMWEMHKPDLWVFGHHHHNVDIILGGCRFVCIASNDFIDIDV